MLYFLLSLFVVGLLFKHDTNNTSKSKDDLMYDIQNAIAINNKINNSFGYEHTKLSSFQIQQLFLMYDHFEQMSKNLNTLIQLLFRGK
jgi:hypothetical protein